MQLWKQKKRVCACAYSSKKMFAAKMWANGGWKKTFVFHFSILAPDWALPIVVAWSSVSTSKWYNPPTHLAFSNKPYMTHFWRMVFILPYHHVLAAMNLGTISISCKKVSQGNQMLFVLFHSPKTPKRRSHPKWWVTPIQSHITTSNLRLIPQLFRPVHVKERHRVDQDVITGIWLPSKGLAHANKMVAIIPHGWC